MTNRCGRRCLMAGATAILAVWVSVGAGADTVKLRDEAYVRGPKVMLGEVAEIDGENAALLESLELGSAPEPGDTRAINASLVTARIAAAGFDTRSVEVTGARAIRTTTLHLEVTPDMLEEDLRLFIETEMPWSAADAHIDVEVPSQVVRVPDGAVEFRWRPSGSYDYVGSGAFRGEVRVNGNLERSFLCKAHVEAYGDVLVTTRDIPRGRLIGPGDVSLEKQPLSPRTRDAFTDPEDVIGSVARSTLRAGEPLTARDVVARTLIKRGQVVLVEVQAGGLVVRTQARAKSDAREGDLLLCTNPESKEDIQGIVGADGTVRVN